METVDDIMCITKVKITLHYHYREYDKHVCNVNFTFNNCRRSQRFFQKKAFYGTIGLKPITTIYKLNYIHGRDICSGSVIWNYISWLLIYILINDTNLHYNDLK